MWLGHHFQGQKVKVTRPVYSPWRLHTWQLQRSAWERIECGKLLLRCRLLSARCYGAHMGSRGEGAYRVTTHTACWSKGWWRWWWQLDYWNYKSCKAPVKSSPPTNQHPVFYRLDALPVTQPTVSKGWRENITFHGLAYLKLIKINNN